MRRMLLVAVPLSLAVGAALAQETLIVRQVEGRPPLDPQDPAWDGAAAVTLTLEPQTVVPPTVEAASVEEVEVRALASGEEIAFRLSWRDPTDDRFMLAGQFSDAVAVMIPYRPSDEVPITMGGPGDRVLILHWAAFREENLDNGYADVSKIHPNAAYDWYPHAKAPYRYPEDWRNQYALAYIGGEKLLRKNTIRSSVREVVAEGFGTSTWKDVQRAEGEAVRTEEGWQVVIRRRFVEENSSNPDWGPGRSTFVSVAVWDGSAGERAGRKSLSYMWTPLEVEAAR